MATAAGMGLAAPSLTLLSPARTSADQQGYAGGATQTSRNLGQTPVPTLVLAVTSALFTVLAAVPTSQLPACAGAFALLALPVAGSVCLAGRTRVVATHQKRATGSPAATANAPSGNGSWGWLRKSFGVDLRFVRHASGTAVGVAPGRIRPLTGL
jgi:hypothetical protein